MYVLTFGAKEVNAGGTFFAVCMKFKYCFALAFMSLTNAVKNWTSDWSAACAIAISAEAVKTVLDNCIMGIMDEKSGRRRRRSYI